MIAYALDAALLAGIVGLGVGWWRAERLRREAQDMAERRDRWANEWRTHAVRNADEADRYHAALTNIAAATRNIKHGTARRVHRMAVQALEGEGE